MYPSHYAGGLDAQQRNAQYLCLDLLLIFVNDMAKRAEGVRTVASISVPDANR